VVRSVLVTAINLDIGSRIWWPSKLDSGPHDAEAGLETEDPKHRADVPVDAPA
jgi:RND superfamily putative drug exporter